MKNATNLLQINCDHLILNPFSGNPRILSEKELFKIRDTTYVKNALDGRKGYAKKFNYCPECGIKIDWIPIKEQVNANYEKWEIMPII